MSRINIQQALSQYCIMTHLLTDSAQRVALSSYNGHTIE